MKRGIIAGAFDIIHPGYIAAFKEAKHYCNYLLVCVQIDPSWDRPEKLKPVVPYMDRVNILGSIEYVNEVTAYFSEADFMEILKERKPDIRFLGMDYADGSKPITGMELNIPIHFLDRSHGWSETKLKKMICESMEKP